MGKPCYGRWYQLLILYIYCVCYLLVYYKHVIISMGFRWYFCVSFLRVLFDEIKKLPLMMYYNNLLCLYWIFVIPWSGDAHFLQISMMKVVIDLRLRTHLTSSLSWLQIKKKKSSFWGVVFSYSTQHRRTISLSDCNMPWKVGFIIRPVTTSRVIGLRRSSKAFPKVKLAPEKGHGRCWVVCCWSNPPQLSESRWNHYIWEVCSANRFDGIGQQKGPSFSSRQHWTGHCTISASKVKDSEVLPHHHIHLTPSPTDYRFFKLLDNSREHTPTTRRRQKMLSKSLWYPETWIFMLQESTYFLLAKGVDCNFLFWLTKMCLRPVTMI